MVHAGEQSRTRSGHGCPDRRRARKGATWSTGTDGPCVPGVPRHESRGRRKVPHFPRRRPAPRRYRGHPGRGHTGDARRSRTPPHAAHRDVDGHPPGTVRAGLTVREGRLYVKRGACRIFYSQPCRRRHTYCERAPPIRLAHPRRFRQALDTKIIWGGQAGESMTWMALPFSWPSEGREDHAVMEGNPALPFMGAPMRSTSPTLTMSQHPLRQCALKPTLFRKHPLDQHPGPHGAEEKTLNA
jgi:hypothetical protein